jgi:hypothetical protein
MLTCMCKRLADLDQSTTAVTGHKLDRIIIGFLALAVAYFVYEKSTTEKRNNRYTPHLLEKTCFQRNDRGKAIEACFQY